MRGKSKGKHTSVNLGSMPLENYLTDAASLLEAASSCSGVIMVASPLFLQQCVQGDDCCSLCL